MLEILNIIKDANKLNTDGSLVPRTSVNSLLEEFSDTKAQRCLFFYI